MRESNFTFPPQNRAVVSITHLLYDRRALDTSSHLAILNNLTSLTYLTSTSPRIREILTTDGGLERLLDILRDSRFPREGPTPHDLWGLSGPPTARVISVDRAILCRHSLAFQCVVNIGVRGSESIRTRVVQAGALDLVSQILESWLKQHGVHIFACSLGSKIAADAQERGRALQSLGQGQGQGADHGRSRASAQSQLTLEQISQLQFEANQMAQASNPRPPVVPNPHPFGPPHLYPHPHHQAQTQGQPQAPAGPGPSRLGRNSFGQFMASLTRRRGEGGMVDRLLGPQAPAGGTDTDIDMADEEGGGADTDSASVGADDSMEVDEPAPARRPSDDTVANGQSATPRASQVILPLSMSIPTRADESLSMSQGSSAGNSFSSNEAGPLPRTASDVNLPLPSHLPPRPAPPALTLGVTRIPSMNQDPVSTQSSPMGTPTRDRAARRDTIVARPVNLNLALPQAQRRDRDTASEASDVDVDLQTATIRATLRAVHAQAQGQNVNGLAETQDGQDADLVVAEQDDDDGLPIGQINDDAMAEEQARLDLEAGAPPGQPGATQTPRVPPNVEPTPRAALLAQPPAPDPANPQQPAQIIIANGAPRGFNDLGSYVGISSLLNPEGDQYSEDSILLSLQLLAYLSKYPHVRAAFHHPRRPMHQTFDLGTDEEKWPLPERPAVSETPNVFTLVERFTFRPSPSDPHMYRIPPEIQYWAGVIMRNACRKDEARGGIRQCANMKCGRWETEPREFAKCRRCRKAKYCSKECQSKAWAEGHKFWCNVKSDAEPGPSGIPPPGFPPGAGGPGDADDDDESFGQPPRPPQVRTTARPQDSRATPVFAHHGRHHGHAAAAEPPRLTQGERYDPLLPTDTQLDLLRQTQRRLRTTTTDEPVRPPGVGGPILGLAAFAIPPQGTTAPSSPQQRMPLVTRTTTHTPPAPGEAFSPLGVHRPASPAASTGSASRTAPPSRGRYQPFGGVVSTTGTGANLTPNRPQMIPTSARTVSPMQPTFQIPVFGQTGGNGQGQAHGQFQGFGR